MANNFKAICTETVYGFRGSQRKEEPSFIEGKEYEFTRKSFSVSYYGLGDFSTVNEQGVESVMDEKHFNKRFKRVEE